MSLIVVVTNISGLAPVSDYKYQVLIGDGTPERSQILAQGEIKQHSRGDGWKALIRRVLDES
jgi:hypothetical protein